MRVNAVLTPLANWKACNVKVYGNDPKSATETKAVMCPRDPDKITAFDTCLATKEIKVPSEHEREVAALAMRECLMAPVGPLCPLLLAFWGTDSC